VASAALTTSASQSGQACEWLDELERIRESAGTLSAAVRCTVIEVATNLLKELTASPEQREGASALLAILRAGSTLADIPSRKKTSSAPRPAAGLHGGLRSGLDGLPMPV
jgi:hypothetical protein